MGFNVSTVSIRGLPESDVHALLGLKSTGRSEEDPDSPVVAATLPSGWYLIYFNDHDHPDLGILAQQFPSVEFLCCETSETVKYSAVRFWQSGKLKWSVVHDSSKGFDHLEIRGELPPTWSLIDQRLRTLQKAKAKGVDHLFDIPVELARDITGFRYDGNPGGYPVDCFSVLERNLPHSKGWHFWKKSQE